MSEEKKTSLNEKLEQLKEQKQGMEQTYSKLLGAIEMLELLIKEDSDSKKKK
jgi:hypothetical protein